MDRINTAKHTVDYARTMAVIPRNLDNCIENGNVYDTKHDDVSVTDTRYYRDTSLLENLFVRHEIQPGTYGNIVKLRDCDVVKYNEIMNVLHFKYHDKQEYYEITNLMKFNYNVGDRVKILNSTYLERMYDIPSTASYNYSHDEIGRIGTIIYTYYSYVVVKFDGIIFNGKELELYFMNQDVELVKTEPKPDYKILPSKL